MDLARRQRFVGGRQEEVDAGEQAVQFVARLPDRLADLLGQRAGEAYGKINRIKRERAKAAAERARQAALRIFTPGCAVKLDWLNIGSTTRRRLSDIGTARGLYVGHASNPTYAIVVFEGLGQRYVENSFLVRA